MTARCGSPGDRLSQIDNLNTSGPGATNHVNGAAASWERHDEVRLALIIRAFGAHCQMLTLHRLRARRVIRGWRNPERTDPSYVRHLQVLMEVFENRAMKFWEVVSAFREDPKLLRSVLASPRWRDQYWQHFMQWDVLVDTQQREILDEPVPMDLTREICQKVQLSFVLRRDPRGTWLRSYLPGRNSEDNLPKLSALDVHERYGPAVIEEVREYGSARVG